MVEVKRRETRPLRVLVVDDESPIRLLCRINLEAEQMEVSEAATVAEGLALARAEGPDVAIIDLLLPDGDGWHVASTLRADPATADAVLIILTAMTGPDFRGRSERLGAIFLSKPFDPIALPQIIRRAYEARVD